MRSHPNHCRLWCSLARGMAAFAVATIVVAALPGAQGDEQPAPAKSPNPVKNTVGRISGAVVRDQGGDPLAGAEVTLLLPAPPGRDYYVWPLPLRQAKTDAQGRFSFENLPPGKYRVWANHEKLTSRRETLRGERVVIPEEGDPPKPLELRMFPGVGVTATVKAQSTGTVIPGAIVHFGWSDFKDDNFATDDKGRVSLQPLAPQRWFIEAWADGFARKSQWLNLESGSDAEVEFLLGPGGNIDGVVRDPAGKAVAGVGISVRTEEDSRQLTYTRTDEEGRYRLNHLPLGSRLELYLSKLDYLRETTTAWANGPKQSLDLTIHPRPHGGSIAGAVFDQEGRPIAGAVLTNMGRSSDEICKATTDKEGKFKLENLYEGAHGREVTVRAKTFAPLRLTVKPGPADKPAEMDIALDAGHTLKGRVEDEAGKPLEGVTVYFAGGGNPFSDGDKTRTDQQGLFEFDSLPPECPFTFFKPGYSRIDRRELQIDSPDVIAVKLLPSGVIRGKVLDATTNKPIRTFRIRITFSPQRQPGDPTDGIASELVNPGQAFQSEQGLFKIGELLLGMPLQVMVDSEGYERGVLERVVAGRADRLEPVEFKLTPIDPASLTTYGGWLRDAGGKPVAGAVLRLIAGTIRQPGPLRNNWRMIRSGRLAQQAGIERFVEGKTDAAGRFEFTRIPKDLEVELVWWGAGIAPGWSDHLEQFEEKDRTSIEIELPAPAVIKATIDRKAFPEISRISLRSRDSGSEERHVLLKPGEKSFEIADLAPGAYTVLVMGPNERIGGRFPDAFTSKPLTQIAVTLAAGETRELEIGSP